MNKEVREALAELGRLHGRRGIAIPSDIYALSDKEFGIYMDSYEIAYDSTCNKI